MKVQDLMTRSVRTVRPETLLRDVASILVAERISGVPVVEHGAVVGVVSEADIVRVEQGLSGRENGALGWLRQAASLDRRAEARTAGEAMTTPAVTIGPRRPISEAAKLMTRAGVKRLPVLDDEHLVGILSRRDLVRAFARSDEQIECEIWDEVLLATLHVDPNDVEVAVEHGVVRLRGRARTRAQAEIVAAFVKCVPGVSVVESELAWTVDDLHCSGAVRPGEPLH
jgi:CBS domain-containing protein